MLADWRKQRVYTGDHGEDLVHNAGSGHEKDPDDPALLSAELTAPAVLQSAREDRQPQCEKESLKNIEKHSRHFCKVYMI